MLRLLTLLTHFMTVDNLFKFPELQLFFFFLKILFIFRKKGREGEKHQCVVASCMPPAGDLATTQACALTGNQTGDPLVHRPAFNPLSHSSQSIFFVLFLFKRFYLLVFREKGMERGRETSVCGCLSHIPHWGHSPQPRRVP